MNLNKIDLSIIVPMYNVEPYIEQCITSISKISGLTIEIIIIDDGSTDRSFELAKEQTKDMPNVLLIHQENRGASLTRNRGLELAKGAYILFLDSDDWLDSKAILRLHSIAVDNNSDIVLGRTKYEFSDNRPTPFLLVPKKFEGKNIQGEKCLIDSLEHEFYIPMACAYLYKRDFLIKHNRLFVDLVYEDEIWTLQTMIAAENVFLTNIEFYHYRQRNNSITTSISWVNRITNLLKVVDFLYTYQLQYSFENNKELKSWIIIKILDLYSAAYILIPKIKNSSYTFPENYIESLVLYRDAMSESTSSIFNYYVKSIITNKEKQERDVQSIFFQSRVDQEKDIILIYNGMWGELPPDDLFFKISNNIAITTDRKYFNIAKAVIFHIPDLARELEKDLDKPEGQIWVAWFLESDINYPIVNNEEFMSLFDLEMSYRQNADIVFPYYDCNYKGLLNRQVSIHNKKKDVCMLISSSVNDSKRLEYLQELMSYIDIDSYGIVFNNSTLRNDNGRDTKLELYSQYKFVIAFENSISNDYVTEKFYDPLIAGSVPIYFGAPNIEEFAPGENSFVDVRDYSSPEKLAAFINSCHKSSTLYNKFQEWRNMPLNSHFREKIEKQKQSPFISLCENINNKMNEEDEEK